MSKRFQGSKIHFHFLKGGFNLQDRSRLKGFLERLFWAERIGLEKVDYVFCSDPYLLAINRTNLSHNYYTDTISFSLGEAGRPLIGEIYISIDRVRDNARRFACSRKEELHRVIFHGALHLCGFPDGSQSQKQRMRQMEDGLLRRYFASA
jgi:probable rRNA maturation factor